MTTDAAGGVWQYSIDLAAGLVSRGAEVLLAVSGPAPSEAQREQVFSISGVHLFESRYALEWMENPWPDVDAAGEWLQALEKDFGANVIHLNGYSHASLQWGKPVVCVAHSCVLSWWRAVHGTLPGPEWTEYRERVARGLQAASAIVAPTATMARNLQMDYGVAAENIRVVHNFSAAAKRVGKSSNTRKEPFIFAAGRMWDQAKNLGILLDAESKLNWRLQVADGKLPHDHVLLQMAAASIFAHPALYEPFGLSVLEAAQAGCCLVLSDIPSLRELWEGAAVFVAPRAQHAWVEEINRLTRDNEERARWGEMAHAASQRYQANTSLHQYWNLYGELMAGRAIGAKETAA